MTETKKQIEQLKKSLPGLKEKVFGVALLLCLSLVMVASVSYAWVTMSTNPEVGAVKTTVAANGALEIALSDFDGLEPEKSGTSDSFAAEGQTTHAANTSWGNLVNLSSGYGVDNLVLRPAKLDLTSPSYIYSMKYGKDGRVEGIISDFGFTTWYQTDKSLDKWQFVAPSQYPTAFPEGNAYGVRAISTVAFEGQEDVNLQKINTLNNMQRQAKEEYVALVQNETYVKVIQNLVQKYLDENISAAIGALGGGDFVVNNFEVDGETYVRPLTQMMQQFYEGAITSVGESLVYAANLQMEAFYASPDAPAGKTQPDNYTLETLLNESSSNLLANGIKLTALGYNPANGKYTKTNTYKKLHDTVLSDLTTMKENFFNANGEPIDTHWLDIEPIVNNLININTVKVEGKTIGQIAGMGTGALDFVRGMPDPCSVVVYNGSLYEFELLAGEFMNMRIHIEASVIIMGTLYNGYAQMTTNVSRTQDSAITVDRATTETIMGAVDNRKMIAKDTYGMILDLWVRTNADSSMLILNGTPEVVERQEPVTVKVAGHNAPRDVYTYTYYTGKTVEMAGVPMEETRSVDVYEVQEGQNYYYYYVNNHDLVYEWELVENEGEIFLNKSDRPLSKTSKDKNGQPALVQKTTTVYDVTGFTTANRIWQEDDKERPTPGVGEISTTQGSGSCYIFRADSEEEYENTKNLLKNLRLVFLDENGKELSRARLDIDRIYAENGKYTVPLYLESYNESVLDEEGNEIAVGLCRLEKNIARRISVLVYLEGENLENDMVMTAESVFGSLNLQFDSTADLRSVGDTDLATEVLSLTATLDSNTQLEYSGQTQYVALSAKIDGLTPQRVEATFARMYTATQGTLGETIELLKDSDGFWKASMPFLSPGRYVLEALTINGVDYKLPQPLEVNMSGFNVSSADFETSAVLTVDRRTTKQVTVRLNSAVMPKTVVAQFVSVDEKNNKSFVNVPMRLSEGAWFGDAVFTKSGQYTLTYLIMDGEPYELPEAMQKSFMAYLGLTADVVLERYVPDDNGRYTKVGEYYEALANGDYVQNASGKYVKLLDGQYVPYEGKIYEKNADGSYAEVAEGSEKTAADGLYAYEAESYVAIKDGTYAIGPLEYDFSGNETIYSFVKIYDDAGVLMNSLGEITLYYAPYGSAIVETGFNGNLVWNGEEYAGQFSAKMPGRFVFGELRLGGNERIKFARSAPELRIRSTVPPSVTSAEKAITYENGTAYYHVVIENAATANSWVVMTDGTHDYTVPLTASGTTYRAAFPDRDGDTANGVTNSNGEWTVKTILFDNVYANDKFYVEGGEKYEIDIADKDYTIVNYLIVETNSVTMDGRTLGDGAGGFMQPQSLKNAGLSVTVKAPIGKLDSTTYVPASVYAGDGKLESVSVSLKHDLNTTAAYGGYTVTTTSITTNIPGTLYPSAAIGADDTSVTFTLSADVELQLAGVYALTASASLGGKSFSAGSGHQVIVYSKPVSVTIGSAYYASSDSKNQATITNGTSVTVYAWDDKNTSCSGSTTHHYYAPYVTLSLVNRGNTAYSAELIFNKSGDGVFSSDSATSSASNYTWAANGSNDATCYIGKVSGEESFAPVNGAMQSQKLILKTDGTECEFAVTYITITNPA